MNHSICALHSDRNVSVLVVLEAINVLQNIKPLSLMGTSQFLEMAASDHCRDIGVHGIVGHEGSDGSTVQLRIEKYCQWRGIIGENVVSRREEIRYYS